MRQEQAQGSFGHAQEVATACTAAVSDGERLLASDPRRDRLAIHRAAYGVRELRVDGRGVCGPERLCGCPAALPARFSAGKAAAWAAGG